MLSSLTKHQRELYCAITSFINENVNPRLTGEFDRDIWTACANHGIMALSVPEEYGGLGESYLTVAMAMVVLGQACNDSGFVFAISNHMWACQETILRFGTKSQLEKYMPSLASGNHIGAFAVTEPEAGSDTMNMCTHADSYKDGYVLNGRKCFISNAPIADLFVVIAKTSQKGNVGDLTAFLVEKTNKGVLIGKETPKMGLNSCPMADVVLDNCYIDKKSVLGKVGSGINVLNTALDFERCFEFAPHIGAMKRIMNCCVNYGKQRKQFNKSIDNYQSVAHKISDMKIHIRLAELLLTQIARGKDEGKLNYCDTSIFKVFVSESYKKVCLDAMQIFGAYGYVNETGIERELQCALASTIYAGTSEVHRNIIHKLL